MGERMESMVFISGAAGGLGRVMAAECARRGYHLFLTDLCEEPLQSLAAALRSAYRVRVEERACDLSDMSARSALFRWFEETGLRFWMVVNVAGVDYEGFFLDRTRGEIARVVRVNVESTLDVIRALLELRDNSQTMRIINVCSLAGFYPMPVMATYAATKRLLINLSIALSDELAAENVTVTALCPAGMPTNENSCKGIEAQGIMGRLTTLNTCTIAAHTVDYALRGKRIYIPGAVNRILHGLSALVPATAVSRLIGRRWKSSYTKRAGQAAR